MNGHAMKGHSMNPNTQDTNTDSQSFEKSRVEEPSLADADVSAHDDDRQGIASARHKIAERLERVATQVRPRGGEGNKLDSIRRTLASGMEDVALRVDQGSWSDLQRSASDTARKYPLGVLAVGVGLGLLTGRMLKR